MYWLIAGCVVASLVAMLIGALGLIYLITFAIIQIIRYRKRHGKN